MKKRAAPGIGPGAARFPCMERMTGERKMKDIQTDLGTGLDFPHGRTPFANENADAVLRNRDVFHTPDWA